MKLELKHLAPYLPYSIDIEYYWHKERNQITLDERNLDFVIHNEGHNNLKPILRPLSDLNKEIEHNGETFVPMAKLEPLLEKHSGSMAEPINEDFPFIHMVDVLLGSNAILNKVFALHFDVFGLINNGLAVNINTLKK